MNYQSSYKVAMEKDEEKFNELKRYHWQKSVQIAHAIAKVVEEVSEHDYPILYEIASAILCNLHHGVNKDKNLWELIERRYVRRHKEIVKKEETIDSLIMALEFERLALFSYVEENAGFVDPKYLTDEELYICARAALERM